MLDWEENLFLGLKALYRRTVVTPRERRREAVRAHLGDHRRSLLVAAEMLAGQPLAILETDDPVLCSEGRVHLPPEISVAASREANVQLYEARVLLAALAVRDGWKRNGVPLAGLAARCREEFPCLDEKLEALRPHLPADTDLWAVLGALPDSPVNRASRAIELKDPPDTQPAVVTTEIHGRGQTHVEVLPSSGDDGDGADLPTHTFEKVETLEEYTGMSRKSDGEDELADHEEALQELKMSQVLRSPERPRSIYRSDVILDGLSLEVGDEDAPSGGIPYPEWDYRRQAYRDDWCRVRQGVIEDSHPGWPEPVLRRHRRLIHRLRCQFATLTSDWLRLRRQPFGSEFDIDALVDSEVERRTHHTPSESVYLDRRRDLHDIAAVILMDQSYSTDAWLQDRRVLDIISESVFCAGEVLEEYIEKFAIATFTSNTRRSCEFNLVKDFGEEWHDTRGRLGSIEARGYTRIGPALRHAQERLLNLRAARKVVLLLTDGRPCDYDRYEGTYGIKDVRKAIEIGRQHRIETHAFAIERQAAEYFPQMFTQHNFDILPTPDRLAQTMCRLFARLLAS